MGSYRYLEDVALADCAVDVTAAGLDDLFETAARALTETMVDPGAIVTTVERHVALEAASLDLLLFDWLSELVYRKDEPGEAYARTDVRVTGGGPYRLQARLHGGPLARARTGLRADPKGVTLHRYLLECTRGGWHARFVLDL